MRLEGDPAEAEAFIARLQAAGVEVAVATTKNRGGFVHVYSAVRLLDDQPLERPARD